MNGFFEPVDDELVPAAHARSPWSDDMMHGRLLAGLLADAMERAHGDAEFQFARLTVDLFRSPPMAPVTVTTEMVRDGRRIRAVDGSVTSEGTEVARGSAVLLRRAEAPEGTVWSPPAWNVPHPDEIDPPARRRGGRAIWETRPISSGGFGSLEQKRTWLRESRPLVSGQVLSPFVRAAVAADFANPFANSGDAGLQYINADITLYLHRLPESDWLGFEVTSHQAADGVAVGHCAMYDTTGPIGQSTVCAVANPRARRR
jgi:hypothetical protein